MVDIINNLMSSDNNNMTRLFDLSSNNMTNLNGLNNNMTKFNLNGDFNYCDYNSITNSDLNQHFTNFDCNNLNKDMFEFNGHNHNRGFSINFKEEVNHIDDFIKGFNKDIIDKNL